MLRLVATLLLVHPLSAAEPRLTLDGDPAPFALDAGFVELAPGTTLQAHVEDAGEDDELILDIVRIAPLGRGRVRLTVVVDGVRRPLAVVAVPVEDRPVGELFASPPVRRTLPLPTGAAQLQIVVDDPLALRLALGPKPPPGTIPLVPLTPGPATPGPVPVPVPVPVPEPTPTPALPAAPPPAPTAAPTPPAPAAQGPATTTTTTKTTTTTTTTPPPPRDAAPPWPRLIAEVHAGSSAVVDGLQPFVPGGGVRVLVGPRGLDAALGFALDFDGQSTFLDAGSWEAATTRVRLEAHWGFGDIGLLDARLAVAGGAGARFTTHHAQAAGARRTVLVVGGTARLAPEATFPAGPGRFAVELPLDVNLDMPGPVRGFAPVAAGIFLGYRLEL